ncbi:MAG: heparan-alpha-glucosaminide N-acetyltransferase domain-containing protein, partial [Blastopirellula sp. JB062]
MATPETNSRLLGLDVARAIAIGGMALIHFATVLSNKHFGDALGWLIDKIAGRPAAAFMILAGIGVSLQVLRSDNIPRRRLWRRGLFFLAIGYANLILWPADILRVYGVAYLAAALLATLSTPKLWVAAGSLVPLFAALVFSINFETNWDFETLHYENLWTLNGGLLNLFYNGFRAVLPWLSLFFLGMIIGRQDLRSSAVQNKLIL